MRGKERREVRRSRNSKQGGNERREGKEEISSKVARKESKKEQVKAHSEFVDERVRIISAQDDKVEQRGKREGKYEEETRRIMGTSRRSITRGRRKRRRTTTTALGENEETAEEVSSLFASQSSGSEARSAVAAVLL